MTLIRWLCDNGLSDGELAALVNVDRSTISKLKRGKLNASLDLLRRVAEATQGAVTPNDFLCLDRPDIAQAIDASEEVAA